MSFKKAEDQWWRCVSCGGVYNTNQAATYFHKCPSDTDMPRDEHLDDTDPEKPIPKAGGKGRLKASKPEPIVVEDLEV